MYLFSISKSGDSFARGAMLLLSAVVGCGDQSSAAAGEGQWLGPCAAAVQPDGRTVFLACERAGAVLAVDAGSGKEIWRLPLGGAATGLAPDSDAAWLAITRGGDMGRIVFVETATGRIMNRWDAATGVCSPVIPPNGGFLYVCNRYQRTVAKLDMRSGGSVARQEVLREPVCVSLSADGTTLAVANLLPVGRSDTGIVHSALSVLDAKSLSVRGDVFLPNGSTSVRGVAFHPSESLCAVVHNVARFQVPTTQVEYGWMEVGAVSFVDVESRELRASVVLDEARRGAANPWAVCWTGDGQRLCITHAGTHELSVINYPALKEKLKAFRGGELVTDFSFLKDLRRRVALGGNGPRAVVAAGNIAYVAEYFSDTVSVVDLESGSLRKVIKLGPGAAGNPAGTGERLFNDATICHQGWQSCASCHPDGRMDGLNWDLLNDGIGNPKNTKGLLLAHRTPPAMSLGARETAEQAVRSGLRHILFANRPESDAKAIDEYLRGMKPVPSPLLVNGELSQAARRGKRLFEDPKVGCAVCHPGPLFTDCKRHVVSDRVPRKEEEEGFDTPTLVECWRTAPYWHDGSAATMKELLTTRNRADKHGRTSQLSARELEDLVEYVLSL